jgi:hypothetical protein
MNENAGDESDPQPYGLFYSVKNGYILKVLIREKGGYNNYEESVFLPQTREKPLAKTDEAIAEILAKRHDLPSKFASRDLAALQAQVDRLLKKGGSSTTEAGFDDDNTSKPQKPPQQKEEDGFDDLGDKTPATKPAAKPAAAEEKPASKAPAKAPAKEAPAQGGGIKDQEIDDLLKDIKSGEK